MNSSTSSHGNPNHRSVDEALKAAVLELYRHATEIGDIHFRFEDRTICIDDLLRIILTSSENLVWPIDKDELAVVWPKPFLIPLGRQPAEFESHLTDGAYTTSCPETVLDPTLVNLHEQQVGINRPSFPNPNARVNIIVQQPSHEVYISTFWHDWVRGREGYMKRLLIPYPCAISTLLLSTHTVGIAGVRYSVSLLPHLHQSATRWNGARNPSSISFLPYALTCRRQFTRPNRSGLCCIIWNSLKATLPTVRSILYDLLCEEKPHIVVVLGSSIDAFEIPSMAGPSGFNGLYKVDAEGYEPGMFVIWRPMYVTLTKLPSNPTSINVIIEVNSYS